SRWVGRGKEQGLALAQGRGVLARLNTCVEGVKAASGGEPDRELVGQLVDRRLELDGAERCERPFHRVLPEPAVEELRAWIGLVRTRPLDAAQLVEPPVRHARMHR